MIQGVPITTHAIERYQERVDPNASCQEARAAIWRIVCLGRRRAKPRHWCADRDVTAGTRFCFWSARPGVCVITADGTAVTVITRELVKSSAPRHLRPVESAGRRDRRSDPADVEASRRWRWDGDLGEAA